MVQCKQCPIYSKIESDTLRSLKYDDYIVDNEPEEENINEHFCIMYKDGIPSGIVNNIEKCEYVDALIQANQIE